MDSDKPSSGGRKPRFAPKPPSQRKPRATATRPQTEQTDDAGGSRQLLQHLSNRLNRRRQEANVEDTSSVQAALIHGPKQSTAAKTSNVPQDGSHSESSGLDLKHVGDGEQSTAGKTSNVPQDGLSEIKQISGASGSKSKEYMEPWDYAHTYAPNTVPWRRPYSGDPDVLDEAEFGEAAQKLEHDENTKNFASELGFLDSVEGSDVKLLFFQLPSSLPAVKQSASAKGKEKAGTVATPDQRSSISSVMGGSGPSIKEGTSPRGCSVEELPAGQTGKLQVYKSGAVKLKLGDTLCDVSPGTACVTAQEVVAINTKEKVICSLGELHKKAVVTPDIESLLNSEADLGWMEN